MRGFAGVDLLVLDEAMIICEAAHSVRRCRSSGPSKAERGPQLWYTGSAVDQENHDYGVVWTRVRERGHRGDDASLAYFEWSVDVEHPDDVTDEMMADTELWARVNFAIGRGRVTVEHMEWERRAMSHRGFAVELLGGGDYPPTDASADVLVQMEDWVALEDPASVLMDPVVPGVRCVARPADGDLRGRAERGRQLHVEVVTAGAGTGWVAGPVGGAVPRWRVVEIVCDGYGPSAAIARKVGRGGRSR